MAGDRTVPFRLVKRRLLSACRKMLRLDQELFDFDVNERTLTQRLSLYLQPKFPTYSVDCEYNRKIGDPKRLRLNVTQVASDDTNGVTVFPDIVVHKRGVHVFNLLAIEAKKNAPAETVPLHDAKKLNAFTDFSGDFQYTWGAFVNFHKRNGLLRFDVRWFWQGSEHSESEVDGVIKREKGEVTRGC
jgi:hypothetical protein